MTAMYPYPAPDTGYAWPAGNGPVHLMSFHPVISDYLNGIITSFIIAEPFILGLNGQGKDILNVNYD